MKLFLIALLCFSPACLAVNRDDSVKQCFSELKIDPSNYSSDDPKCMTLCVFKKLGIVTGNCVFNQLKMQELIPDMSSNAVKMVPQCLKAHQEPDCCKRLLAVTNCVFGTN